MSANAYRARLLKQLEETDAAISRIMTAGQSASFSGSGGNQQVTQANLKDLQIERERLERLLYGRGIRIRSAISS
ncbi:MAG: hypothetical protein CMB99_16365 [Flavobacteriaceae bacterium]|nr:hypothetical protein [Flavobacteriaceae bacterium]|tara:strand:- start:36637 stop:36861 length:225 start_codon:yes stop_codon:yes gene_type:complete